MHRIKETLRFSTAEQKKETLGYEPPEGPAWGRIRVWGLDSSDEWLQKFQMGCLENALVGVGDGSSGS